MRSRPAERHIRVDLPLEQLAHGGERAVGGAMSHHVADQHAGKRSRQFGSEVANLVGMRKHHVIRLVRGDQLPESKAVTIGRVVLQQRVVHGVDLRDLPARQRLRRRFRATARHGRKYRQIQFGAELLTGRQRFKRHLVQFAVPLFQYHQNAAHITLASNRSFSTSCAAASFGGPSNTCERFDFSGR